MEKDYRDASMDQYIPFSSQPSLHVDYKMYILLALLWSWGELYTEGENEFGSGENQRLMKTEKEVLNEPLSINLI